MRRFSFFQEIAGTYTFLIFLVLMIFFTIFVFFKVPETKNKTFEEIASRFAPGTKIEVEEIVEENPDDAQETDNMLTDIQKGELLQNGSLTLDASKLEDVMFKGPEEKMSLTKSEERLYHSEA